MLEMKDLQMRAYCRGLSDFILKSGIKGLRLRVLGVRLSVWGLRRGPGFRVLGLGL